MSRLALINPTFETYIVAFGVLEVAFGGKKAALGGNVGDFGGLVDEFVLFAAGKAFS